MVLIRAPVNFRQTTSVISRCNGCRFVLRDWPYCSHCTVLRQRAPVCCSQALWGVF